MGFPYPLPSQSSSLFLPLTSLGEVGPPRNVFTQVGGEKSTLLDSGSLSSVRRVPVGRAPIVGPGPRRRKRRPSSAGFSPQRRVPAVEARTPEEANRPRGLPATSGSRRAAAGEGSPFPLRGRLTGGTSRTKGEKPKPRSRGVREGAGGGGWRVKVLRRESVGRWTRPLNDYKKSKEKMFRVFCVGRRISRLRRKLAHTDSFELEHRLFLSPPLRPSRKDPTNRGRWGKVVPKGGETLGSGRGRTKRGPT